jgi:hypothetical protein
MDTWNKILSELHIEIYIPVSEILEKEEKEKYDRKRERTDKGTSSSIINL